MNLKQVGFGLVALALLASYASASWLPDGWSVNTPSGVVSGWNCSATLLIDGGSVTYATAPFEGGIGTVNYQYANGTIFQDVLPSN